MAFLSDQNTDNTDANNPSSKQNNTVNAGGSSTTEAGGATSSANGTGNQGTSVAKPSSSGRFTNISNYIKANQGFNQAGGGLAGSVASNINQQGEQAKQGIQSAQSDFNAQAKQATDKYNPYATPAQTPTSGQVVTTPPAQNQQAQAAPPPTAADYTQNVLNNAGNLTPEQTAKFTAMRDAQYGGPQGLANQQQLQANVQNVQNAANQTGTEAGRYNLLRNTFNNVGYTGGQQKLDNLLMQGNQQQLNALTGTRTTANQLQGNLTNAAQQAGAQAQQYGNEALSTQQATRGALNKYATDYATQLQNQANAANTEATKDFNTVQGNLAQGNINAVDLTKFGIDPNTALYNLDPSQYLTKNNTQATMQNIAGTQDYSKIAGLGQLAGGTATPDTSKFLQSFQDQTQAGTFANQPTYTFDKNAFNIAQQAAASKYGAGLSPLQEKINNDKILGQQLQDKLTAEQGASYDAEGGQGAGQQQRIQDLQSQIAALGQTSAADQAAIGSYNTNSGYGRRFKLLNAPQTVAPLGTSSQPMGSTPGAGGSL